MAQRPASSPADEAVVVRNIDELAKAIPKQGRLLIHFTQAQWAGLTKDIEVSKVLPKYGITFAYTPLPDDTGGLGEPMCMPGKCEICLVRIGRNPDGSIGMQCRCRHDPDCPPELPSSPSAGRCNFILVRRQLRWTLECVSAGCTGQCRIVLVRRGGRSIISCACQ